MVFIRKQFSPNSQESTGSVSPKKAAKLRNIPWGDSDFLGTAKDVNTAWKINPQINLAYTDQPEFEATLGEYETSLTGRQQSGSKRPGQTLNLKQVNKKIDEAVTEVKNYIEKKFKSKNAKPQFPRYGITKQGGSYKMVLDKDERVKALELMSASIAADGFGAEEFGTAFWADIIGAFKTAVSDAKTTDKSVTGGISLKKQSRKMLEKVMKSLILVLEGNYPDTYKAVLRQWGFLKVK